MKKNPNTRTVAFVLLDYKKGEKILKNIQGILAQKNPENGVLIQKNIYVMDNSCDTKNTDILKTGIKKIKEEYKNISLNLTIADTNLGYSQGNNQAIKKITEKTDYICILNPDIIWTNEDTLALLLDYMESNPKVGICAPKQINMYSQSREISVREFPHFFLQILRRTPLRNFFLFKKYIDNDEMLYLDSNTTQEVDWVQSSFLLIPKLLWDDIGGFDEKYFLFMADTQLCYQSWRRKRKVVFFADTQVGADGLRCSRGGVMDVLKNGVLRQHIRDAFCYFLDHFFDKNPRKFSSVS